MQQPNAEVQGEKIDAFESNRVPPVPVGTLLRERFELCEIIGRGGMSTVYRATDRLRKRARFAEADVAIKVVDAAEHMQSDAIELLHREARRAREVSHPNIVDVYDSDCDGPLHFIVMELMHGRTLAAALKERDGRPLRRGEALLILTQIGSALALAHRAGVVHADVKPGNVFLCRDGRAKLFDFGLAQSGDITARPQDEDATIHYLNRVRGLTPGFASLAMLRGEAPEPTDDIYGLGLLAYILLSGRHPFDGKTAEQAVQEDLMPKRPADVRSRQWRTLCAALSPDPQLRPKTVEAFIAGMRDLSYHLPRLAALRLPALRYGASVFEAQARP
jgi:serine/threonine protein kinase